MYPSTPILIVINGNLCTNEGDEFTHHNVRWEATCSIQMVPARSNNPTKFRLSLTSPLTKPARCLLYWASQLIRGALQGHPVHLAVVPHGGAGRAAHGGQQSAAVAQLRDAHHVPLSPHARADAGRGAAHPQQTGVCVCACRQLLAALHIVSACCYCWWF